jgi:hypothetical protein
MQIGALPKSCQENGRAERRFEVQLSAVLRTGLLSMPVRVRNLSRSGALVQAPCAPPNGGTVTLSREGFAIEGTVMWVDGHLFGLRFEAPMRATELLILLNKSRTAAEPMQPRALSA